MDRKSTCHPCSTAVDWVGSMDPKVLMLIGVTCVVTAGTQVHVLAAPSTFRAGRPLLKFTGGRAHREPGMTGTPETDTVPTEPSDTGRQSVQAGCETSRAPCSRKHIGSEPESSTRVRHGRVSYHGPHPGACVCVQVCVFVCS